jgi:D-amino peptidase
MKVYIVTDLEGISGITHWDQTRDFTTLLYQEARHLLTAEVAACVQGCLDGGADEIIVNDGHGGGFNLVPEELHPGASYVTGMGRPDSHPCLDETVDALVLLGYHAMNGTVDGVLHHTQSSVGEYKYWYNGVECGEIVQSSLVAGYYGVPPVMCTGDERACQEARRFLGESIVTVAVKQGLSRTSCRMLAPSLARDMIREAAQRAMGVVSQCRPLRFDLPIQARFHSDNKDVVDSMAANRLSTRVDDCTLERTIEDPRDIYRF